jgi:hypothetical protein
MRAALSRMVLAACSLASLSTGPAQAEEAYKEIVPVGRVKVVLPQPGWLSKPVELEDIGINKGIMGTVKSSSALFVYRKPGETADVLAALMVYTTPGIARNLRMTSSCPAQDHFYVRDYTGGGNSFPQCLRVFERALPRSAILEQGMPDMRTAARQSGLDLPAEGYPIFLNIMLPNASVIMVQGIVAPGLRGLPGVTPAGGPVPLGMPTAIAAWSDALGDAAQNALKLFRDEMPLPQVEFLP